MTRSQVLDMLAVLVTEGTITEAEAADLLRRLDAGEITAEDLPLPPGEEDTLVEEVAVIALLLLFLRRSILTESDLLTDAGRAAALEEAQDRFEARVDDLARAVRSGRISVREWHEGMSRAVREDAILRARLGAGRDLTARERREVREAVMDQLAFLRRYAETLAAKEALGEAMSGAQIRQRARMYGGRGRALFYRFLGRRFGSGTVVYYRAIDSPSTCMPCLAADRNSPYPADGSYPVPSSRCLGAGLCRCTLRFEQNPALYEQITGRRVAA